MIKYEWLHCINIALQNCYCFTNSCTEQYTKIYQKHLNNWQNKQDSWVAQASYSSPKGTSMWVEEYALDEEGAALLLWILAEGPKPK